MDKKLIDPKYLGDDQLWLVTTEGDCEGKTIHTLGYYTGNIADIALSLADKAYYTLRFAPIVGKKVSGVPMRESVDIAFGGNLYTSDIERLVSEMKEALGTRVNVSMGQYGWGVKLTSKTPLDKNAIIRQKALEKLSDEEIEALGLSL